MGGGEERWEWDEEGGGEGWECNGGGGGGLHEELGGGGLRASFWACPGAQHSV